MLCYFKLSEASLKIALNLQSKTGGGKVFAVITAMAGPFQNWAYSPELTRQQETPIISGFGGIQDRFDRIILLAQVRFEPTTSTGLFANSTVRF